MSTLAASAPPPSPPAYKNRRGLLIFAGVVELLMAAATLAMVTLFLVSSSIWNKQPPPPGMSLAALRVFTFLFYGGIGAFLIVLGIGTILAKNWARILGLIASWFWLAMGVIGTLAVVLIMPVAIRQAEQQSSGPPVPRFFFAIISVVIAAVYVGVPLMFLLIYSSRNVRMTCLAASGKLVPVPPTGGVSEGAPPILVPAKPAYPIAVGILVGWFVLGIAFAIPALLLVQTRAYPFFGTFLYGIPARIVPLALVSIHAIFVWHLYKLRPLGWWGNLVFQIIFPLSTALTMWRYGAMGYLLKISPELRDNPGFQMMPLFFSRVMPVLILVGPVVILVYLLCIRRYFQPSAPAAQMAAV